MFHYQTSIKKNEISTIAVPFPVLLSLILLQVSRRYVPVLRSLNDEYCIFRTCPECEALWVITSYATAPPVTMEYLLSLFNQNTPPLDNYWTTDSENLAEATAMYNANTTLEQRRLAFGFDQCLVVSVYKAVFGYSARLCKPIEFMNSSNKAFYMAAKKCTPLCQVINAHLSQRFIGRYLLFQASEYIENAYLSGWFRAAGCSKTEFSIGPGNMVRLGLCLDRGKTCADRASCKTKSIYQPFLSRPGVNK